MDTRRNQQLLLFRTGVFRVTTASRAVLLLVFCACVLSVTEACTSGFYDVTVDGVTRCVKPIRTKASWQKSRENCKHLGGDLIALRNSLFNNAIRDLLNGDKRNRHDDFWIGLNQLNTPGAFVWLDDKNVSNFTDWEDGKYSNHNGSYIEKCAAMGDDVSRTWFSGDCDSRMFSICEKPDGCPSGYSPITVNYTRDCVRPVTSKASWRRSRHYCQVEGGDLLTIKNSQKNAAIQKLLTNIKYHHQDFWFGLNQINTMGTFVWLDEKQAPTFYNYIPNDGGIHPNNDTYVENCAAIGGGDKRQWFSVDCLAKLFFICEQADVHTTEPVPASIPGKDGKNGRDGSTSLSTRYMIIIGVGAAVIVLALIGILVILFKPGNSQFAFELLRKNSTDTERIVDTVDMDGHA